MPVYTTIPDADVIFVNEPYRPITVIQNGWTPIFANVPRTNDDDTVDIVQKIVDWTGGFGTKPQINLYVGSNGFVSDIDLASVLSGKSAYASWLSVGNEGTEQDFIDSLSPFVISNVSEFITKDDTDGRAVICKDKNRTGGNIFINRPSDSGLIVNNGTIYQGANGTFWEMQLSADDNINLNYWGVDSTGTIDETVAINNAIIFCATNGYKYLNVSGIIKVTGRFSDYKNQVLFIGGGEIRSTYKYNYGETNVSNTEAQFSGLINKQGDLTKTVNILAKNTALKIVVFGDSIAYNRDYDTTAPNDTFFEIVNNETVANSWYANFIKGVQKRFPNKAISIANRAIPGFAISSYNSVISDLSEIPSWYVPEMLDKTWIDILKDEAPDLLIIQHGMNSDSTYIKSAIQFIALVEAWTKVPEIVIMSTPTLNYIDALSVDWAGAPRLQKFDVGNQQYSLANFKNAYLIDVARISSIKRYGVDFRTYNFKPKGIQQFAFQNGASVLPNGNIGIPSNGKAFVFRYSYEPKFFLSFSVKPDSAFTFFRINTGESFVIFSPTSVTVYPLTNEIGSQFPAITATYTLPIGVATNIRIEYGDFLNLYIDNKMILTSRYSAPIVNVLDDIVIDIQGNVGTTELSLFQYYEAEYATYKPTLTGQDLYGKLGSGTDGNAINHPTLVSVSETYNKAVNEFLDYLYNKSNNLQDPSYEVPYLIFNNGVRSYSLEGNNSSFGLVDQVDGVFRMLFKSNGTVGFGGITNPTSSMSVGNLGEYADNDAAIADGHTAGAFYRTGDVLKVVH